MVTIKLGHPSGDSIPKKCAPIKYSPSRKPTKDDIIPTYVENLNGMIEKFVKTLNHNEIDL
jgi:hypothetical protein